MTTKIASLVTEEGHWLPVKKRTGAVIAEIHALQDRIESCQSGQLEIMLDFKNHTVRAALREYGERKKIN